MAESLSIILKFKSEQGSLNKQTKKCNYLVHALKNTMFKFQLLCIKEKTSDSKPSTVYSQMDYFICILITLWKIYCKSSTQGVWFSNGLTCWATPNSHPFCATFWLNLPELVGGGTFRYAGVHMLERFWNLPLNMFKSWCKNHPLHKYFASNFTP